jgi:S1-C subfamily serine protease
MAGTMKVFISTADARGRLKEIGGCSATLVHPSGLVLTNWHCIGYTNQYGADDSGLNLRHGDMYHPQGLTVLGPTIDPQQPPQQTYVGTVVQGSPDIDIAVVKITKMYEAGKDLPATLPLPAIPLADSSKVNIGDHLHVFGYPSSGGPLLTITSGQVSGFYQPFDPAPSGTANAFKTDADIEAGNSGGLATNDAGEQVGIPAFGPKNSRLSGVIQINLAKPFIEQAIANAVPLEPRPGRARPSAAASAIPAASRAASPSPSGAPPRSASPAAQGSATPRPSNSGNAGAVATALAGGPFSSH